MFSWYRRWRHAGEENAVVVYNYSIGVELIAAVVVSAVLAVVLGFIALDDDGSFLTRLPLLLAFLYSIPVLAKRRIAIIFTQHDLIYRPAFASQRIPLRGVTAIKKSMVNVPWPWEPFANHGRVEGVLIELPYGQSFGLRLDLPNSEQIIQRLSSGAGIPAR